MSLTRKRMIEVIAVAFVSCASMLLSGVCLGHLVSDSLLYYINECSKAGITCDEARRLIATQNAASEQSVSATKNNGVAMLFMNARSGVSVSSEELGTEVRTNDIAGLGDSFLLLKDAPLVESDSDKYCVLGFRDAYELFGSTDVVGLTVILEEKRYTITAVTGLYGHLLFHQAQEDELLDRTMVHSSNARYNAVLKQDLGDLEELGVYIPKSFLTWLVAVLMFFALLVPAVFLARILLDMRISRLKRIILLVSEALIVFGFMLLFIRYPFDMIPPKWSDFDFWKYYTDDMIHGIYTFLYREKTEPELRFISYAVCALLGSNTFLFSSMILIAKIRSGLKGMEEKNG